VSSEQKYYGQPVSKLTMNYDQQGIRKSDAHRKAISANKQIAHHDARASQQWYQDLFQLNISAIRRIMAI
jgi:hypothetical protein